MSDEPGDKPPTHDDLPRRVPDPIEAAAGSGHGTPARTAARLELIRRMLGMGYSPSQVINWLETATVGKDWVLGRTSARNYVDRALETLDAEVSAPKNRKQARTRAMLTMLAQRAIAIAHDPTQIARAPAAIVAGIAALDKIARIDGAYEFDASSLLPASAHVSTPEEAVAAVRHATATVEMALRRGALTAGRVPPPVIDATSTDVEDDDGVMEPTPSGDAN